MSYKNTEQERAVYEKAIKNPNVPENVKEIARKKLADLEAKTPKKEVKEKVVKQPEPKKEKVVKKAEPKKEKAVESNDYDCDELINKEKETRKKRKIAAEKRAGQPKKKPATKIKEGIETISDKIEGGVEKGNVSKAELEKLIASTKALLSRLEKQLEGFSAKKMAKGGVIPRTKKAVASDKNLRAMPKGERVSHPFAIIRKANGKVFKRRNANQFGKVEGGEVYHEYRSNRVDKDQKKRF